MSQKPLKPKSIEIAHRWLAKAIDALEEARVLIPSGQTRIGGYSRLYYAVHHMAVALLRLVGSNARTHSAVRREFGKQWVTKREFPKLYGRALNTFYEDRLRADYGEYVPTMERDLTKRLALAERFLKRALKEIPPVSTADILAMLCDMNPDIRDFSFDIYCPKSYFHHTRFTVWLPKGRVTDRVLQRLLRAQVRTLQVLKVDEATDYVIGLNSRVNQYAEMHVLMLDFDNVSTLPYERFNGEPGFFFRTASGFHFIGAQIYTAKEWKKRMRVFSRIASKAHFQLSLKRGYGTLRLTASPRKPITPAYIGRSR